MAGDFKREEKLVVIFDLDGTMVADYDAEGDGQGDDDDDDGKKRGPRVRPGLEDALRYAFEHHVVGAWTAASREWWNTMFELHLKPILQRLGREQFDFVWTGERCAQRMRLWIGSGSGGDVKCDPGELVTLLVKTKPLRRMWKSSRFRVQFGATKHNTLIVDDTPSTFRDNYGNGICIPTYTGEEDRCMERLVLLLTWLSGEYQEKGSIRRVDKSGWFFPSSSTAA